MKASIAIQVLPVAPNQDEMIRIVDEVIAYIKSSGLHCHVGPFETTIEGEDYDQFQARRERLPERLLLQSPGREMKILFYPQILRSIKRRFSHCFLREMRKT